MPRDDEDDRRGRGRTSDRPPSRDAAARRAGARACDADGRWRSSSRFRGGPEDDRDDDVRDEREERARLDRDDDAASYRGHAPARQDDRRYLVDRAPDVDRWYGRDLDEELDHGIDRGFSRDADERHDERGLLSDRGGSGRSFRDLRPRSEQRDRDLDRDEEEDRDGLRRDRDWRRDEDDRDRSLDRDHGRPLGASLFDPRDRARFDSPGPPLTRGHDRSDEERRERGVGRDRAERDDDRPHPPRHRTPERGRAADERRPQRVSHLADDRGREAHRERRDELDDRRGPTRGRGHDPRGRGRDDDRGRGREAPRRDDRRGRDD